MGSGKWDEIKSLFFRALERGPAEREEFLSHCVASDPELIKIVRGLLAANDEAGSILSTPAERCDNTKVLGAEAPLQFAAGDVVADRYTITRYVARGGMGEVYEANDRDLGIVVAIKAIRPSVVSDEELLARFKREIELARRVTHPNVGRIYDFGRHTTVENREVAFLTMEFLHGETLSQRLHRAGPFPVTEALPIIRDIAEGLDTIHECGIVHRDFKTANVMLVQQKDRLRAKVMDFGLARPSAGEGTLTQTGQIGGTPPYMAPEQFENVATAASDIYALGVVIHEVTTGVRPHSTGARSNPLVTALDPVWAKVIDKCLALNPADRYPSGAEVVKALSQGAPTLEEGRPVVAGGRRITRKMWMGVGALTFSIVAGLAWWIGHRGFVVDAKPKHLALLPIHTNSKEPLDQAFCTGLSDTLRGDLAELEPTSRSLWVIPSSEVREIRTPTQARQLLGANLVIEASFNRLGDEISLQTELVDTESDRVVKSDTVRVQDVKLLRPKALRQIARLLDVQVSRSAAHEVKESSAGEPGAFEFYEQGMGYLLREGDENTDRAIELFSKALVKDPKYALAYAGMGKAYAKKYVVLSDPKWMQLAVQNSQKAVSLNGDLAEVHSLVGLTYRLAGKYSEAESEMKKALAIEPECVACLYGLGMTYVDAGNPAEAEKAFKAINNIKHGDWLGLSGLAYMHFKLGHLEKAAEYYRQELELLPDSARTLSNLGGIYTQMGRFRDALPIFERALHVREDDEAYTNLGAALMYLGRYPEAVTAMEHAVKLAPENHGYWRNLGDSYKRVPADSSKALGAYRTALTKATAQLAVNPKDGDLLSSIALYWAQLGDKPQASRYIGLARAAGVSPDVLFTLGLTEEILGKSEECLQDLDGAWKKGYPLPVIESEPELKRLEQDPRYQEWDKKARAGRRDTL